MFLVLLTLIVNTAGAIFVQYSWRLTHWDPPTVLAIAESIKCILAYALWKRSGSRFDSNRLLYFAAPGLLYSILNIANGYAFKYLPVHLIVTVANLKILWVMILSKIYLHKTFSKKQYYAAAVIIVGLVVITTKSTTNRQDKVMVAVIYGLFASVISSMAGTLCEYVYTKSPEENIHAQNIKLYAFGTIFNTLILFLKGGPHRIEHWSVYILILYYALSGIVISFVMKYLGNVVRNLLGALTLISISICSYFILGNNLTIQFVIGGTIVIIGMIIYNLNNTTEQISDTTEQISDEQIDIENQKIDKTLNS